MFFSYCQIDLNKHLNWKWGKRQISSSVLCFTRSRGCLTHSQVMTHLKLERHTVNAPKCWSVWLTLFLCLFYYIKKSLNLCNNYSWLFICVPITRILWAGLKVFLCWWKWGKQKCYPAQFFVLQRQHPCALCKQFHLDSRQRVCGGEVPLGPPAERHNKGHSRG